MTGTIKVSPSVLKSKAADFATEGNKIQSIMTEMMSAVTNLSNYWTGEAATTYINRFRQLQDDITRMVKMCTEHSNDLQEMADVYLEFDQSAAELASGLATEVIV